MKTSTIKNLLFIGLLICSNWAFAGSFMSNGTGGGLWNSASSWTFQNDSNGIPDSDDDIIILYGDVITWNTNTFCRNVTIKYGGELSCSNSKNIQIYGNYENSGTESGNGFYYFNGPNSIIGGYGIYSSNVKWHFNNNTTIQPEVVVIKNLSIQFYHGSFVTNYGNVRVNGIQNNGSSIGTWINAEGSILSLKSHLITVKLDAGSLENTVKTMYGSSDGKLPNSLNKVFYHLEIGNSIHSVYLLSDYQIKGNLTISNGGELDMNGFKIHLKGNFSNSETFLQPDTSILYMDGSDPQLLESYVTPTALSNLVIDNVGGVFVGGLGNFTISNSLIIANGELDLEKNLITLLSNENKTAYIGESYGTVTGTLTVQRFISDRNDGYSDMSSSVTSGIFYDWTDDLDLAFGPYIPEIMNPSCWSYSESFLSFNAIEEYNDTLIPGKGYKVFLNNDGDVNTPFIGTTLDMEGTPNLGNISIPVTNENDGWNLIGNPYASAIDWTHFKNNCGLDINAQFRYFDETINGFSYGNDGDIIVAGQGFWIQTTESGNVTFQESNKVINTNATLRIAENSEEEEEVLIEKTEWVKIQPTQNGIELELLTATEGNASVTVYNLAGQEIVSTLTIPEDDNRLSIPLPELTNGVYIIHIINGEKIESKKFYHN